MAEGSTVLFKDGQVKLTDGTCTLGQSTFEMRDVTRFGSVANTFGVHWALRIGLVVLGLLAVSSAVRGIMTGYWLAAVVSTVLALPLFVLAALKETRLLTIGLADGRQIEYIGGSSQIRQIETAIGLAKTPGAATAPA